jgi:alanyl-tRNA synthetase
MQFDRSAVVDAAGKTTGYKLTPLPKPSIDTGMGLERVAAVLQGKVSNFETDLFTPLITSAAKLTITGYGRHPAMDASLRIIADHSRAATFLIADGVIPGPNDRGSVLRRIIRRALKHSRYLMHAGSLLPSMSEAVAGGFTAAYPELLEALPRVKEVLAREEVSFRRTLTIGFESLKDEVVRLLEPFLAPTRECRQKLLAVGPSQTEFERREIIESIFPEKGARRGDWQQLRMLIGLLRSECDTLLTLSGRFAFFLHDSLGFPPDFTEENCRDLGISYDSAGFESAMEEQRAAAKLSWKGGSQKTASPAYRELPKTDFLGYRQITANGAEVLAIVKDGAGVPAANAGDEVEVVLDRTSFYGDSGGQTGDTGWLTSADGNTTVAEISGCVLPVQGVRAHKALLKQPLAVGDRVNTVVDSERRNAIKRNHTGTHLIHAALREVLGTHVKQAGSAVHPERLRFDFSHFAQVADEELEEIESIVNREVLSDARVETLEDVPIDVAVNEYHAMALFGEKYGDKVRVVKLSDGFSTELCGGTHTAATGEIGLVKIVSEGSVSSGVRRLEAISGLGALDAFRQDFAVSKIAAQIAPPAAGASPSEAFRAKLASQEDELKRLRRELEEARMKAAAGALDAALARSVEVKGVRLVTLRADSLERGQLRTLVDNLKQKLGEGVVVVASAQPEGKVALIAGVTPGLVKRIQAGKLVGAVAKLVGGSGGGKPEIAEAGGKDQGQIDAALQAAAGLLAELLG